MAKVDGIVVSVGDWVGFKSDIEQYGTIIAINGNRLTIENRNGFSGAYIGGDSVTTQDASDCWLD